LQSYILKLPFDQRRTFNATFESLADSCAFILDTTTVKAYMPQMQHGDWERFGKEFWNHHKKVFGVKLEIAAATQRRPVPVGISVAPAGMHDLAIARRPGGVFSLMQDGERALGDPGYLGEPSKIYAPPRRNMESYVPELDKAELNLQRRVEMLNRHFKTFKVLGTTYRKGAVRAFEDLKLIAIVVAKLVYLDMILNQAHSGDVHTSGPIPDPVSDVPCVIVGAGVRSRLQAKRNQRSRLMQAARRVRSTPKLKDSDVALLAAVKRRRM
jgi:hypothetical protein